MRRYIFMFIICISSFMIYTNNVKAEQYFSGYSNTNTATCSNGTKSYKSGFAICNIANTASNFNTITEYYIESNLNNNNNINKKDMLLNLNVIAYSGSSNITFDTIDINELGTGTIVKSGDGELMPYYIDQDFRINNINGNIRTAFYNIRIYVVDDNNNGFVSNCKLNNTNSLGFNNVTCPITKDMSGSNTLKFRVYFSVYNSSFTNIQIGYHYDVFYSLDSSNVISNNTQQISNDIKDSSIDNNNATGTINNLSGQLASDNTITSLLLLPINFINVLIDGLSGQCAPYSLGELWGSEIVLPCVNLYNTFGAIWYMVDTGLSALVIFKMSKYFIRLFNKLTNLKDGGLEEAYS